MTFLDLLRDNSNYRRVWLGQVVSDIGDHFNNIAVFSLALDLTRGQEHRAWVLTGVFLSRGVAVLVGGPMAGVVLDRFDRRRVMMASDIARAILALGFIAVYQAHAPGWTLYLLSGLLMFCSPFFTSGRSAILPTIASKEELPTANALTQTTSWLNTAMGAFLGGTLVDALGYDHALGINSITFVVSALCLFGMHNKQGHFRAVRAPGQPPPERHPWHDFIDGLRYIRRNRLLVAVCLVNVGWATGGGAAQILFTLFGKEVFQRGAQGIGIIWGWAGVGLVVGGLLAHRLGKHLDFVAYTRVIALCYIIHGVSYVTFSRMESFAWACFFIGLSRTTQAVSSVLNYLQVLRETEDAYRGRVFATLETVTWSVMMFSMMGVGAASDTYSPRDIGTVAGLLASLTAVYFTIAIRPRVRAARAAHAA